jgi:lysophospholipase L1-like esterase
MGLAHPKCVFVLFATLAGAFPAAWAADANAPIHVADYKPPIRVACLGDSITYGVGAKPGWSWPEQLDRMLSSDWDVRNFGHSGASVAKEEKHTIWNQTEYKAALLFHPDVVLILLGTNDTKPQNWERKGEFPKLYRELVSSFQKLSSKPRIFCCTPPYVPKKGNFGINEPALKEQIPMIQSIARECGAGLLDIHAATEGKDPLFPDNVHPNTEGAALIARTAYKALTGKEWQGEVPGPLAVRKRKPMVRQVENPGELTYRDAFTLIAAETGMPPEKLEPIRARFEETVFVVENKLFDLESQIEEYDQLRMRFKHTPDEDEKALYGEYKGKVAETRKEMARYKMDAVYGLIALIPQEHRGKFGAAWLGKYVFDRLAPISATLTPEQRKAIRALCEREGPAHGKINNTPERSIHEVETYKAVYETVLDPEQKKRADPR